MRGVARHVRGLWPGLGLVAPLPLVLWPALRLAEGHVRWDYVAFMLVPLALAYATPATKKLFVGLYPLGLVGVLYDSMKLVEDVGVSPSTVHLCDLRAREIAWFGITMNGERTTVHDWLQAHATPALDVYFSIPYATFLFACIGFAVYLWRRDFRAMQRFTWCFLALNVAAFATYHLYPAAPPWYFHEHGCVVDIAARASEGPNLARVDRWLGVGYFHGMYGRASDVFGAMPSLHVAYPLTILLVGWPYLRAFGRALAIVFFASMLVAAPYLDHHWILDEVAGLTYAVVAVVVVNAAFAWLSRRDAVGDRAARAGADALAEGERSRA